VSPFPRAAATKSPQEASELSGRTGTRRCLLLHEAMIAAMQPCGGAPGRRQLSVRVGTERPRQRDFDSRTRPVGGQAPPPHGQHAIKRAARKTMFRRLCLVVAAATAAQIAGDAKRASRGPLQALRRMKRFAAASGPIATLPARRNEPFFPKKKKPFRAAQGKKRPVARLVRQNKPRQSRWN